MCLTSDFESGIRIPGTSSGFLDPAAPGELGQGRLRYLTGGTGTPLVLLHTVRTQAEHFRHLIPWSRTGTPCTRSIYREWATRKLCHAPPTRNPACALPSRISLHDLICTM